jgi:hypothetical protein
MGFFGFVFWLVVLCFAFKAWNRWQYRRWMAVGPRGHPRSSGWYDSSEFYAPKKPGATPTRDKTDDQQAYIDALESRVSDLEERLDFTERLLAGRRESEIKHSPLPTTPAESRLRL